MIEINRATPVDAHLMVEALADVYRSAVGTDAQLAAALENPHFVLLAAWQGASLVGYLHALIMIASTATK